MEGKFNRVACRSCTRKACAGYVFHGGKSPCLIDSEGLGKPDCIFIRKITNLAQFQALKLSRLELRRALRASPNIGLRNPYHPSFHRKQRELCFKLVQQGKLRVVTRPSNGKELDEFRKWAKEERWIFPLGSLGRVRGKEEEPAERASAKAPQAQHWIKLRILDEDTDEPVEGVTMKIKLPTGEARTFTTNKSGTIEVKGVPEGTWDIQEMTDSDALEVVKVI